MLSFTYAYKWHVWSIKTVASAPTSTDCSRNTNLNGAVVVQFRFAALEQWRPIDEQRPLALVRDEEVAVAAQLDRSLAP